MYDNLLPLDRQELEKILDTWRSKGNGYSIATPIGRLIAPPASGPTDEMYLPRSEGLAPDTVAIHELFGLGVRHYLTRSGITEQNARIDTELKTGNYTPADRQLGTSTTQVQTTHF